MHNSADRQVLASSYTETNLLSVSIEQDAELTPFDRPVVRLEGAASAPMTPSQAMELAAALQQAAFAAVSGGAR